MGVLIVLKYHIESKSFDATKVWFWCIMEADQNDGTNGDNQRRRPPIPEIKGTELEAWGSLDFQH